MPSILNATTTNGLVTSADNSGSLQLQTNNGTTAVTIDTSQNVGIGTASPSCRLDLNRGSAGLLANFTDGVNTNFQIETASLLATIGPSAGSTGMAFKTGNTERMRIDASGFLNLACTGITGDAPNADGGFAQGATGNFKIRKGTNGFSWFQFYGTNTSSPIGSISNSNNTGTTYATSSDYRLKENIAPMTGALEKVQLLKPCTYTWKLNGLTGQGFIAHELQEVVPECVVGEKDAVQIVDIKDEEGNVIGQEERPVYQGIDTSFLVATLTAAIQELKAELDATKAEVQALKGVA